MSEMGQGVMICHYLNFGMRQLLVLDSHESKRPSAHTIAKASCSFGDLFCLLRCELFTQKSNRLLGTLHFL